MLPGWAEGWCWAGRLSHWNPDGDGDFPAHQDPTAGAKVEVGKQGDRRQLRGVGMPWGGGGAALTQEQGPVCRAALREGTSGSDTGARFHPTCLCPCPHPEGVTSPAATLMQHHVRDPLSLCQVLPTARPGAGSWAEGRPGSLLAPRSPGTGRLRCPFLLLIL